MVIRAFLPLVAARKDRKCIRDFWRENPGTVEGRIAGFEALGIIDKSLQIADFSKPVALLEQVTHLGFMVSMETIAMLIARAIGDQSRHDLYRESSSRHILDLEVLMGSGETLVMRRSIDAVIQARNIQVETGW